MCEISFMGKLVRYKKHHKPYRVVGVYVANESRLYLLLHRAYDQLVDAAAADCCLLEEEK